MKKRHRASQQPPSASSQQGKKGKGGEAKAGRKPEIPDDSSSALKSKYYKGTITQEEIPKLLAKLDSWSRTDILLVTSIMRTNLESGEIQHCCLKILAGDGSEDIVNHGTAEIIIGASGGIELVLAAMRAFADRYDIQEYGCHALMRLAIVRENLRKFVRCGGFETLIWQIHHNNNGSSYANSLMHIHTLRYTIALLLSNRNTEKSVQQFVTAGGIEAVVGAMRSAFASEEFLHACLYLLNTLCTRKVDVVTSRISRSPFALETITAAMVLHPHSRHIQNCAAKLVHDVLAHSPRTCERFCACEGVPATLAALLYHKDRPATVNTLLSLVDLTAGLCPTFQDTLRSMNGIELLIALLRTYENNSQVQPSCFKGLASVARASCEAQDRVEMYGGIAAALFALRRWEKSQRKTLAVCDALFAFTWANPNAQAALCSIQGINVLVYILSLYRKTSRSVSEAIAKLIVSVLSQDALHDKYLREVEQELESAFTTYPDSFELEMCIKCLNRESNVDEGRCTAIAAKETELECAAKGDLSYNWCQTCYTPQLLYRCLTCDDIFDNYDDDDDNNNNNSNNNSSKKRTTKVYCKYCWMKNHAGHEGVEMFIVGSCSSPPSYPPPSSSTQPLTPPSSSPSNT